MAKKNFYQLALLRFNTFKYELLSEPIEGHIKALNQLNNFRSELMAKGLKPGPIRKDAFILGTDKGEDKYRLVTANKY